MFQRITSLENRLFEDHAGTYRASLIRQLSEERARLAAYLQQASSTEQKEQRRNTLWQCAALEYAQAVIDAVWNIYHHLPSWNLLSYRAGSNTGQAALHQHRRFAQPRWSAQRPLPYKLDYLRLRALLVRL